MLERAECIDRKTLDNNYLNQVVASSGFTENKGLSGGGGGQPREPIKPSSGHYY